MTYAMQKYRIKGDYYQKRVINPVGIDTWKDTKIRATPYKWCDLIRLDKVNNSPKAK